MRLIPIAAVALILAGCGSAENETPPADAAPAGAASESAATAAVPAAPAATSRDAQGAEAVAMVQTIYALPARPAGPQIEQFFARDLAAALLADETRPGGPRVDVDYRYAGTTGPYTDVRVTPFGTNAYVEFTANGETRDMIWSFCTRPDGQRRIEDVVHAGRGIKTAFGITEGAC